MSEAFDNYWQTSGSRNPRSVFPEDFARDAFEAGYRAAQRKQDAVELRDAMLGCSTTQANGLRFAGFAIHGCITSRTWRAKQAFWSKAFNCSNKSS